MIVRSQPLRLNVVESKQRPGDSVAEGRGMCRRGDRCLDTW